VVLLGVFLALADLGVPLGVCAVLEAHLVADFKGVAFAFGAVTFLRIVRVEVVGSRKNRKSASSRSVLCVCVCVCVCFDALTMRVCSLASASYSVGRSASAKR
jgi:hypothetical protein